MIGALLETLYGSDLAPTLLNRVQSLLGRYRSCISPATTDLSERDCLLITYGDQVQLPGAKPLPILSQFVQRYLFGVISGIHLLPFYPWSSDDGFSVIDYRQVDPALGNWDDIAVLQMRFQLMFDGVINHISAQSMWFEKFLNNDPRYQDYFITPDYSFDTSNVIRPRALPLLTTFNTPQGEKRVWTTFSADQVDLNYKNPEVLLEILDILLMYVEYGARFIRLDAIAFLWKESGTTCIHLPKTHLVIQFLRAVMNEVAPHVQLITETNVPHRENISYFGDGHNEAQLVYNFALPPLTLHALHTGDATTLSEWVSTLILPSTNTTFFNFLASHDGIGLNPVRGILSSHEIDSLVQRTMAHGGLISYKNNPDGSQSPYEMNINYFDALSDPNGTEPIDLQVDRFIAAQAIMLALVGVPGIYFHSLFGSRGWLEGVQQTGHNRTINREKLRYNDLFNALTDADSLRSKVFQRYRQLLIVRRQSSAFNPHGSQKILNVHPSVFALERLSPTDGTQVLCLHNVSDHAVKVDTNYGTGTDLPTNQSQQLSSVSLKPYQVLWIKL
jgi:sucrose phosphorylase